MLKSSRVKEKIKKNLTVVLVSPHIPENIGLVARAVKNTGCAELAIVADSIEQKAFETAKRARDVLEAARVYPTLRAATDRAHFVYGTTRRNRQYRHIYNFRDIVPTLVNLARSRRVQILFGKENFGLSQKDIECCDDVFCIPAQEDFPSYNLASCVTIVCYTIFEYLEKTSSVGKFDIAAHKQREVLYAFIEETLNSHNIKKTQKTSLLYTLRRIFSRTQLTRQEIEILKRFFLEIR